MLFGDVLKKLRLEKGVTQKQLGDAIGISDRVIGYYESNDRFPKEEKILKDIATYFEVSTDYLLGNTSIKDANSDLYENLKILKDFDDLEKLDHFIIGQEFSRILSMIEKTFNCLRTDLEKDLFFKYITEFYFNSKDLN